MEQADKEAAKALVRFAAIFAAAALLLRLILLCGLFGLCDILKMRVAAGAVAVFIRRSVAEGVNIIRNIYAVAMGAGVCRIALCGTGRSSHGLCVLMFQRRDRFA